MKKQFIISFFVLHSSLFTLLTAQNMTTAVGNSISGGNLGGGYSGDGGTATAAELMTPYSIAFDGSGNMYIADQGNQVIREVDHSTGNISTIAGNHAYGSGYSGDGGAATNAELYNPAAVAVDDSGNVYIADAPNNVIREVNHSSGIISTIAGNYAFGAGYSGDGAVATAAELNVPTDVTIDTAGNIYIADNNNNVIRKIDHSTSIISTVAGNHNSGGGFSGDGGAATNAELNNPTGVSVDESGNIYIADYNNQVIRKVDNNSGIIGTVAGNQIAGYSGDTGPATAAELNYPWGVKADGAGNLFIADQFNSIIREVYTSNGNINTVAGNDTDGFGYSGDNGPATAAELYAPVGVGFDAAGDLYIADADNNVIREVYTVAVGINKITPASIDATIYPNPNKGEFTVMLSHSELVSESQTKIEIYNVFGERVYTPTLVLSQRDPFGQNGGGASFTYQLNISSQPSGVYFVQIINQNGSTTQKVMIEK